MKAPLPMPFPWNRKLPSLPRAEWDFSQVEDVSLPLATIWEYARSCPALRADIVSWLESKADGKTVRKWILEGLFVRFRSLSLEEMGLYCRLMREGQKRVKPWVILRLLTQGKAKFPDPWTSLGLRGVKSRPDPVLCTPLAQTISRETDTAEDEGLGQKGHYGEAQTIIQNTGPPKGAAKVPLHKRETSIALEREADEGGGIPLRMLEMIGVSEHYYDLTINWEGYSVDEILRAFERWLREEARRHPKRRKAGKPGQAPTEKLKWLAAYRLQQAGLTFAKAQALLPPNDYRTLPWFADNSSWSRAVCAARRELARFESFPVKNSLLLQWTAK